MTAFVCLAQRSRQVGTGTVVEIVPAGEGALSAVDGLDREAVGRQCEERGAASSNEALSHVSASVRGEAVVRRLASGGVTTYVEVGSGTVVSGPVLHNIHREATSITFGSLDDLATVESAIHV